MPDDPGYSLAEPAKLRLLIRQDDLPCTARELRDLLAASGWIFERGVPVRLVQDALHGGMVARSLALEDIVHLAHAVSQPYVLKKSKQGFEEINVTLPNRIASLYLAMAGDWHLLPLHGIATGPLLAPDGEITIAKGYDRRSGQWCAGMTDLSGLVPDRPSRDQAMLALAVLRRVLRSFPFADAARVRDPASGIECIDPEVPPGQDESSLLAGLLTAVCRASLPLAPGLLIHAPMMSGSGTGKGLLARLICMIAFGQPPQAFTGGANREEMEKRLAAELMEAAPALLLDNLNGIALRSDLLASVLTERPARVRLLGQSAMVSLNPTAFIVLTGNGLTVAEDLSRRFLAVGLDARMEDPEARRFDGDLLTMVEAARLDLLAAALTIWRWGRQADALPQGLPLGSFGPWCAWVRDPLLALGCADPVARIGEAKAGDARRQMAAELFLDWHTRYGTPPMRANDLDDAIKALIDPQGRGRQYQAAQLAGLVGTRTAGFAMTWSKSAGKWSAATYAVISTSG
jgi:hypothetical protein